MTDAPLPAYDSATPNVLADVPGQDIVVLSAPPLAPEPLGETFTDEGGNARHVLPREDGHPVALQTKES